APSPAATSAGVRARPWRARSAGPPPLARVQEPSGRRDERRLVRPAPLPLPPRLVHGNPTVEAAVPDDGGEHLRLNTVEPQPRLGRPQGAHRKVVLDQQTPILLDPLYCWRCALVDRSLSAQ